MIRHMMMNSIAKYFMDSRIFWSKYFERTNDHNPGFILMIRHMLLDSKSSGTQRPRGKKSIVTQLFAVVVHLAPTTTKFANSHNLNCHEEFDLQMWWRAEQSNWFHHLPQLPSAIPPPSKFDKLRSITKSISGWVPLEDKSGRGKQVPLQS